MQKIGKEIKIGLAVIGVLVAAFGYILFRKLTRPEDLAATPAASAAPSATTTADASNKPTVVSATDTAHPADAATDGANSSRSLFASTRRVQASDTTDPGADPHGSFMPAANNAAATTAPANSGAVADGATAGPPENRFSQFGNGNNAAATGSVPADDSASNTVAKSHKNHVHDGNRSLFSSGSSGSAADAPAPPATVASDASVATPLANNSASPPTSAPSDPLTNHGPSPLDAPASPPTNLAQGAPSSDPFAQKSTAFGSPQATAPGVGSVAATQAPGLMPVDPSTPPPAAPADSNDGNPLRHMHERHARPTQATGSAAPSDTVSSDAPLSTFGATSSNASLANSSRPNPANANAADPLSAPPGNQPAYPSAQVPPPPVTPNAISVPSSQLTPTDPTNVAQPLAANSGANRPGQYIVQPNDNYWTISEKVYGTGGYFKAIYEHNRRQHSQSDRLQVGDALEVPEVALLQQSYPDLCPKPDHDTSAVQPTSAVAAAPPGTRSYAVADGDTLYEIARRELGRASRWGEIYQLNHDQLGNDFGYLRPGTQLLLPSDSGAASVARGPSSVLQR